MKLRPFLAMVFLTGIFLFAVFLPKWASGEVVGDTLMTTGGTRVFAFSAFGVGILGIITRWIRSSYITGKRYVDIVMAIIGLVLSAPIMAVSAILIKLDSRGAVFYRQKRVGKDGKLFNMYKLRTMGEGAEKRTGPVWAADGDARVTRIGRFLRARRIDELPQFYNVLRGDMSLVGPRPERPFFARQIAAASPGFSKRLSVKPGITGLAQVRYRYGASIRDARKKLRYDLLYCRRICLLLDIRILAATAGCVIKGSGAR